MDRADPTSDLTAADFSRLRPAYGFTDALSLSVSYGFTLADLRGLVFSADHPSEVQRTALHEAVHISQMLATSYGYYCQLLRDFQATSVIEIVRSIRTTYDTGPRLPIYKQVLGLPRKPGAEEASGLLLGWYKAELMLRWFEGNVAAFTNLVEHLGPKLDDPMIVQFAQVNYWLTHFARQTGRARLPAPDPVIRMEREARETAKRERHLHLFKILLDSDAAGVLESAARASEYWEQHGPVPDEMHGVGLIPSEMIRYQGLLREAIEALPTGDTHTFALTYAIIVDVVLNAPLLPQHAAARSPRTELADLDPIARMRTALAAAGRLRPVSDLSAAEYERFAGELCAACGWPTPSELARLVLPTAPEGRPDHLTELYLVSLRIRAAAPQAFVDLSVYYRQPRDQLTATLQHYFSPPIVLFTDTFRLHNDRELVRSHIDSYLLRTYLRAIMLTPEPTITLPYPGDDEEVAFWTRSLREALADVGFANPAVRLVPGRLRVPHTA